MGLGGGDDDEPPPPPPEDAMAITVTAPTSSLEYVRMARCYCSCVLLPRRVPLILLLCDDGCSDMEDWQRALKAIELFNTMDVDGSGACCVC